jgi:hypothetical protein
MVIRKTVVALFLLGSLPACYDWHVHPLSPDAIPPTGSGVVRVSLRGGQRLVLRHLELASDTLRGWGTGSGGDLVLAVPLSQVTRLETRTVNPVRAFGLTLAMTTLFIVALDAVRPTCGLFCR